MARMIERTLAALDYPMTIVTAANGVERSGCLVGFGTQCSIHPLRWLTCLSKRNHTYTIASAARTLVVHLLHDDQHALAELFGAETGDAIDKFARCSWRSGPDGVPVIEGCDWIAGSVLERFDLGDHVGHLLELFESGHEHPDGPQLGFQRVRDIRPGHEP